MIVTFFHINLFTLVCYDYITTMWCWRRHFFWGWVNAAPLCRFDGRLDTFFFASFVAVTDAKLIVYGLRLGSRRHIHCQPKIMEVKSRASYIHVIFSPSKGESYSYEENVHQGPRMKRISDSEEVWLRSDLRNWYQHHSPVLDVDWGWRHYSRHFALKSCRRQ